MMKCTHSPKTLILIFMTTEESNYTNLTDPQAYNTSLTTFCLPPLTRKNSNTTIPQRDKSLLIMWPEIHIQLFDKIGQMESLHWEVQKELYNGGHQEMESQESSFLLDLPFLILDFTKVTWLLHLIILKCGTQE